MPNAKVGITKAISAGWLKVNKEADGNLVVVRQVLH